MSMRCFSVLCLVGYDPGGGGGGGGTLIFSAYVGSDPASTVHPQKLSEIWSTPKKYSKFLQPPKKYPDSVYLP